MTDTLLQFHFLRPAWLLAVVPAAGLTWLLWRHEDVSRSARGMVAQHLIKHLVVGQDRRARVRPSTVLPVVWLLTVLALAGPTWRREPSPFGSEQAALVVVLEATPTMLAQDVAPSRLERARHKLHDLVALRPGARTALVAYSGSAHLVVPLTTDGGLVEQMAAAITPSIMPREGNDLAAALALAQAELASARDGGSILILADGAAPGQLGALERFHGADGPPVQWLAVVPSRETAAASGIEDAAHALGAPVRLLTPDDADVVAVQRRAAFAVSAAPATDAAARWRDEGYGLVPVIAATLLLWARRGWSLG